LHKNRFYLIAADVLAFMLAYVLGGLIFWQIRGSENLARFFFSWASIYLAIVPVGIAWFYVKGHYTRRWPFWDEMRGTSQVLLMLAIIEGALIFLTKSTSFSRIWFTTSFLSLFALLPAFRVFVKWLLSRLNLWRLPTAIVGSGHNAKDVLSALKSEHLMGFDVRLFLNLQQEGDSECKGIPVLSSSDSPEEILSDNKIRCVVVAFENDEADGKQVLIERLQRFTQDLYIVPAMRGIPLYGMEIHHFFRHEVIMMRVRNNLLRPVIRFFKRGFDIIGSIVLLFSLAPLLLILGLMVRMDGGPVLFTHKRVGLRRRSFECLKFRSMVVRADEILQDLLDNDPQAKAEWDADFKLKNDPRLTRIGGFLRNSSLDELPQLWNVLRGDMSLVGPRPLVEEEVERYGDQVDYYLQVRPGMTGLWQVSGRNDVDYSHRVYLDVWYVKNWSLWYDIAILFKTFKVVLKKHGAY